MSKRTMSKILIAGGSLGGLFAANLLLRAGHDVLVLEKATGSLDGRGAGIVTHAALTEALERAGTVVDDTLGVPVQSRVVLDPSGKAVARLPLPQVLTSWSRLYHLLRTTLPDERYRQGCTIRSVSQTEASVAVTCDNGASFEGELLIASDGIRSVVRAQFAPQAQPRYAGYVAWRGVCDEGMLSELTLSTLFDHFGFCLPRGEQIIGYPVAGSGNATQRGRRRYNFVWYRPAAEGTELDALLTDADGQLHAGGIPPNKVSWRAVAAMREAARRLLAPQFAEILEKTAQPFLQPIFDVRSDQVAFGRVALMGDAAFVARPHVGMGVTKAADDAVAIVERIARHGPGPQALLAYEAMRLPPGQKVVERGRYLGTYMQAQGGSEEERGKAESRRDAETVMAETAVDIQALLAAA